MPWPQKQSRLVVSLILSTTQSLINQSQTGTFPLHPLRLLAIHKRTRDYRLSFHNITKHAWLIKPRNSRLLPHLSYSAVAFLDVNLVDNFLIGFVIRFFGVHVMPFLFKGDFRLRWPQRLHHLPLHQLSLTVS